jgi:uncharacterized protein (TIGR02266 family)
MNTDHARAQERVDLEVNVDLESEHNFYTGLAQNISAGGVFIATHHLRRVGERISLKFSLPGSDRDLAVETEVRWIRGHSAPQRQGLPTGMGLRFVNLPANAAAAIQRFLEMRDSIYYDDE